VPWDSLSEEEFQKVVESNTQWLQNSGKPPGGKPEGGQSVMALKQRSGEI